MATKKPAVEIPVRLNKDQAQKDAKGLTNDMVKNFAKIGAGIAGAAVAFRAFGAAMSSSVKLAKESIDLANKQIENERKLMSAANLRGKFTKKNFEELQRLNSETQQATGIGDEYQLQLQAQLALMGVSNEELVKATRATIGLSEATGADLNASMRIVARTLAGNTQSLKRYGIQAEDSNQAMEMLLQNFEIAKDRSKTLAGQVKILDANFGDFKEVLGRNFAESQTLIDGFESLNKVVLEFTNFFQSSQGARAIDRFFKLLIGFAAKTIDAFTGINDAADVLRFKTPASVKRQEVYESAREQFLQAAPRAHVFDPVTGQPSVGGIDYDLINQMAREFALERVPLTITEIAKNFADELRAVAMAPYKKAAPARTSGTTAPPGGQALAGRITLADPFGFEADEAALERKKELDRLQLDQTIATNELRFQAELQAFDERQKLKQREIAATENFYQNLASIGIGGMANFISGIVQAGLSGEVSLGDMMKRLFGGMLSQVGQMLISLGTAAFAAASASTAIPFLWPITGGPPGAAAALGMIAAGAALTGVGGYVSSTASSSRATLRRVEGTARRMAPSTVDRAGRPSRAEQETTQTVYNINFNGALPGSERRIAREINRIMSGGFAAAGA
tara:strand:- start:9630 stop:11507 length:1878 start_codon:yes stop_codon:yes gene_type:complete